MLDIDWFVTLLIFITREQTGNEVVFDEIPLMKCFVLYVCESVHRRQQRYSRETYLVTSDILGLIIYNKLDTNTKGVSCHTKCAQT